MSCETLREHRFPQRRSPRRALQQKTRLPKQPGEGMGFDQPDRQDQKRKVVLTRAPRALKLMPLSF
jgi:hypothetical protein